LVAQRIRRFARLVGPENLMAGADCGFGRPLLPDRLSQAGGAGSGAEIAVKVRIDLAQLKN